MKGGEKEMNANQTIQIGDSVRFTDALGKERSALLTAIWGDRASTPAVNIVYVSDDESRTDQYGRQTVHYTSVVHKSMQSAHGMFWQRIAE